MKVNKDATNCWKSLLEDKFPVDPWTFSEMEKKMVLERFQREVSYFNYFTVGSVNHSGLKILFMTLGTQKQSCADLSFSQSNFIN